MIGSKSMAAVGVAFLVLAVGISAFALLDGSQVEAGWQAGRLGVASGFALVGIALVVTDWARSRSSHES